MNLKAINTYADQGRSDGGYIGIYTHPKSGQVNILCCNNAESTYNVLRNTMSIKILYLLKTNFWLRPWRWRQKQIPNLGVGSVGTNCFLYTVSQKQDTKL